MSVTSRRALGIKLAIALLLGAALSSPVLAADVLPGQDLRGDFERGRDHVLVIHISRLAALEELIIAAKKRNNPDVAASAARLRRIERFRHAQAMRAIRRGARAFATRNRPPQGELSALRRQGQVPKLRNSYRKKAQASRAMYQGIRVPTDANADPALGAKPTPVDLEAVFNALQKEIING